MKLIKMLIRDSRKIFLLIIILGVVNSLWATFMMVMLHNAVNTASTWQMDENMRILIYCVLFFTALICSRVFQSNLITITNKSSYEFQSTIFQNLRLADLHSFERLGTERIYTSLGDARTISIFPQYFVEVFNSSIYVVCGLIYVGFISPISTLVVILIVVALAYRYLATTKIVATQLKHLHQLEERYYRNIEDFISGFKQMKMNSIRRDNFFRNFLDKNRRTTMTVNIQVFLKDLANNLMAFYSWYLLLGIMVFVLPKYFNITTEMLSAYMIAILFIMSPLTTMFRLLPSYARIKIALDRLDDFIFDIAGKSPSNGQQDPRNVEHRPFEEITFKDVSFSYDGKNQDFKLGPIDFQLKKGTILFITGENGSGKSTFINLLTGLYKPSSGNIYLNGTILDEPNYQGFRNCFSCVFADHHLFSANYDGHDLTTMNAQMKRYIRLFKLENVLQISGDNIKTSISKGQKKRLALILSLMEGKELLVLDEWAAEQDPEFRKYFYTEILPALKGEGRTIVAVTHDDKYFGCADHIYKFEFGLIKEGHYV